MAKNKVKYKKKPKTKKSFSNKKITRPKIKYYANLLYEYEKMIKNSSNPLELKCKIEELVDEICNCYDPQAMYCIDEEVIKIFRKDSILLTN